MNRSIIESDCSIPINVSAEGAASIIVACTNINRSGLRVVAAENLNFSIGANGGFTCVQITAFPYPLSQSAITGTDTAALI